MKTLEMLGTYPVRFIRRVRPRTAMVLLDNGNSLDSHVVIAAGYIGGKLYKPTAFITVDNGQGLAHVNRLIRRISNGKARLWRP